MTVKHSKLPWQVCDDPRFVESGDTLVAAVYGGVSTGAPSDELLANGEFIVRAVNSHDALVEALKRCVTRMTAELPDPQDIDELYFALEVLAKAEKP